MTLYEKFEQVVILVLSVIIAAIVVASVWALMREVVNRLLLGAFDTLDYATFQVVFGMIFTLVIALEFKRALLVATERSLASRHESGESVRLLRTYPELRLV